MKRFFILFAALFISMLSFAQNLDDVKQIKKQGGMIVNIETNEELSDNELKQIFDEDLYSTYIRGKNQRIVSIRFWASTAACAVSSITSWVVAGLLAKDCYNNHNHSSDFESGSFCSGNAVLAWQLIGGSFAFATVVLAVPSTILTISSCKSINKAVDNYNSKSSDLTLNFGATNNGIGFTLKF